MSRLDIMSVFDIMFKIPHPRVWIYIMQHLRGTSVLPYFCNSIASSIVNRHASK